MSIPPSSALLQALSPAPAARPPARPSAPRSSHPANAPPGAPASAKAPAHVARAAFDPAAVAPHRILPRGSLLDIST